jgi:ribosomal protein L21
MQTIIPTEEVVANCDHTEEVITRCDKLDNVGDVTPIEEIDITKLIIVVRDQQVLIDRDIAMLYKVETKVLNQKVKRNVARFPERFRF